ncbi:AsmA-like C-terminal region-containing protein [Alkalitalea saponilacus]|uniref:AsmA family protein n=1 Tax=Alkalitalea saponilacus TaxID=889453 RepID=A0A1T5H4N5_9BACT|nr:AsmA-like C-terminal region-containing protein [Alkalitalea saponilacus]ASB50889.1 AsmA family protein [Alkalitalea saponilacus]SKC15628.1 AsmA family protein [Alkalitalea saponilacus]
MKKFLKIFFGVLAGIFLLLLILPFLFKGKIETKVKEIINEEVHATVSWDKFSLSLIRNFPNLRLGLDGLTIINDAPFEGDTLVHVGSFSLAVDVMSAIRGDAIDIRSVLVNKPTINLKVNSDSIANWDIVPESDAPAPVADDEDAEMPAFSIQLQSFEIRDAALSYSDATMNLKTSLKGFNSRVRGDFTESHTTINLVSNVEAFDLEMDNIRYLNKATIDLRADVAADLENMVFTFEDNELIFSRIPLFMEGYVAMLDEGYDMDLRMAARQTEFRTLLALVPEVFMQDLEGLHTEGSLTLEATAKGKYIDEDNLPAFNVLLDVKNGMIQYPDLPKSINNIQIFFQVDNPGGSMDNTIAEIRTFHFELDNNPFDANLHISTPISNAVFKGAMIGSIDLASLSDAIPMDSIDLKGLITSDLTLDGDYNMIENEQYEDIKANGNVTLTNFEFRSPDFPMGVTISEADLFFSPRYLELRSFASRVGESDFGLTGRLENYLAFALKDGTLKGRLDHVSQFINTNELMALAGDEPLDADQEVEPLQKVLIPGNIEFNMSTRIDRILYDRLDLTNTTGNLLIKDSRVVMNALRTHLLNGNMVMNGEYNTQDTIRPFVDFDLAINSFDINMAAHSFSMVESFLPVAKNAQGQVSSSFKFNTILGDDMSPLLNTFNGGGNLRSNNIEVSGSKVQDAMATMLRDEKYKVANARNVRVNFTIENGNLTVEPFDVEVFGKSVNIAGTQSLDQQMDFTMRMPVSRSEISNVAGLLGGNISSSGGDVMLGINITGTPSDPKLAINADDLQRAVRDEVRREVERAAERVIEQGVEEILKDENVQEKIEDAGRRLRDRFR